MYRSVWLDIKGESIKLDVTVWAQTQNVGLGVRSVVRAAEWADMSCFGVPASKRFDLSTADLAGVAV